MKSFVVIVPEYEPKISGFVDERFIHWPTGLDKIEVTKPFT